MKSPIVHSEIAQLYQTTTILLHYFSDISGTHHYTLNFMRSNVQSVFNKQPNREGLYMPKGQTQNTIGMAIKSYCWLSQQDLSEIWGHSVTYSERNIKPYVSDCFYE